MTPRLTALQRELIEAFFARSRGLFLTGGAVLAGDDFGHRTTDDLDLFGFADLEEQERVLQDDLPYPGGVALEPQPPPRLQALAGDPRRRALRRRPRA